MFFRKAKNKEALGDEELVRLYKSTGELSYLGELYQRYVHLVFGVCLKYLKSEEECKDMSMQIFEKLIDQLKKHEVANFKSWLHVMVKNQCLMVLRSKPSDNKDISDINLDKYVDLTYQLHPIYEEDKEERLVKMENSLHDLPDEQRQCLELFYLEEKCYKEITQITGFDLGKVKSYIQNGKRNMKIIMEKKE